jgi:hypothetical protein
MNNTNFKGTTIANGDIETMKIEAENGLFDFRDMFTLADFDMPIEHEEDHMSYHGMISYTSIREDDGSQFYATISKIGENQDLATKEEAFKNNEIWAYEYFEIIFKDEDDVESKEREYYCLEVKLEEVKEEAA